MLRISIWLLSEKSNPLFVSAVEKEGLERAKTKESELNTVKQPNKSKTSNPRWLLHTNGRLHPHVAIL